ncbi:MAG: sulfonate transport system ATP-binding protein [Alphaproteobacteria bacterium]|jgi:ABC-type nitrate/sulfonate/bicarbonate transport system ATPase subunit|nr:sulfonate transport system ATP-binding protein [Alphaproteobacteria bacterium]
MQRVDSAIVAIDEAAFAFGGRRILDGFSLELFSGQITAMLGPSGSGKTTLLRLISGMDKVAAGEISIRTSPGQTPISYMFQNYDTFPWLTVRRNLELSGETNPEVICDTAERLGLASLLDRYPRQLSGGQSKRVALARSLLARPAVLIMDEPFGSLDVRTKISIFEHLEVNVSDETRSTLFVTHSVEEAVILSDRVLVLSGPPLRIIDDFTIHSPRPRRDEFLASEQFKTAESRIISGLLGA